MTEWILPCRPASDNERDNDVYRYDIDAAYESGKPGPMSRFSTT